MLVNRKPVIWVLACCLPSVAFAEPVDSVLSLELSKVFTFFVLTLGPFAAIRPFSYATQHLPAEQRRLAAIATAGVALASVLVAATVGVWVLSRWGVSVGALLITAGIMLFLVALNSIRDQYSHRGDAAEDHFHGDEIRRIAFKTAFPYIVSPYGVAVVVLVATTRPVSVPLPLTFALLAGIMLFNGLILLLAQRSTESKSILLAPALSLLSSTLAVLQAALGVQAILLGLKSAGAI